MAIALTTQPASNGYYTAYLPVLFVATETTNNPSSLEFQLRNADGSAITGVPKYSAPLIGGEYRFDASAYLKSLFDVRTSQGLSTTAIEELTDLYGKYEVIVTDPTGEVSDLVSNEFYAFAFTDTVRFANDQTANNGISNKGFLMSDLEDRTKSSYNRVNIFVGSGFSFRLITTLQTLSIDLSSYTDKLISIPLNNLFVANNFTVVGGGLILNYINFEITNPTQTESRVKFNADTKCNLKEFIYVNRYGVKDTLVIESKDNESLATRSDEFEQYTTGLVAGNFNTGSSKAKINQEHSAEYEVQGQKFNKSKIEQVKDFIRSPLHGINVDGELKTIVVFDRKFNLVEDGRGVELNFRYKNSQKELAFI